MKTPTLFRVALLLGAFYTALGMSMYGSSDHAGHTISGSILLGAALVGMEITKLRKD